MRRSLIIFSLLIFFQNFCSAQFKKQLDSLCVECNRNTNDSDKVVALGKLADLYYTYKLNRQGDSVLNEQLSLAELSDNNNLILIALFGEAISNISASTTTISFNKTIQFLEKGIDYAKSQIQYDYLALAYIRMAAILRQRGESDKALNNAILATQYLLNVKSDSIKAAVYIELGNNYNAKGEAVSACRNYNTAFDIALKIKSVPLQSQVYHCFAEMYKSLGQSDAARDELKKSLAIDKEHSYGIGIAKDYFDLARLTDEKSYIIKTIELSDSLHLSKSILAAKVLMLAYIEVIEKNSDKALHYLETESDLKESILNVGVEYYFRTKGQIFLYSTKADSALYYFKRVEYDYINNFDPKSSRGLFMEIAQCYTLLKDVPNAINYYTKSLAFSNQMNDVNSIISISDSLSNLYELQEDYKQAYSFSKQAIKYKNSLKNLSRESEIALLGIERENRKHEEELLQEKQRQNNKRDIQYMAITIAIAVIFLGMLIIGMFPVSKGTIRMLGYFFFISLFEFIVMIIDNSFLAKAVHNEPLKLWMVKIFLIGMLVPVQHFLEHNLIKFLESRKLLEARTKFSFKKWWQRIKQPAPLKETGIEEDTAVL